MRNIKVVIGANFGDEGKGLMTDYFCNNFSNSPTLNVRFNGGAQAGHTVVTPNGARHVFSHIGAGIYNPNVKMYLAKPFIVNPILFQKEFNQLYGSRVLNPDFSFYVHPDCYITTPYDMMINQIVEMSRGDGRHGSCGVGINETMVRSENEDYRITVAEIHDRKGGWTDRFKDKLIAYAHKRLYDLGVTSLSKEQADLLYNPHIFSNFLDAVDMIGYYGIRADYDVMNEFSNFVFEGAQGLMLDRDNMEYFPHLTPSFTGMKNVNEIILSQFDLNDCDIEVCYVTRSYLTRHGAGRLDTECDKNEIAYGLFDLTNVPNTFQGNFRYGYFDQDMTARAIARDTRYIPNGTKVNVAMTHLDETYDRVILLSTDGKRIEERPESIELGFPIEYRSYGPTWKDVKII